MAMRKGTLITPPPIPKNPAQTPLINPVKRQRRINKISIFLFYHTGILIKYTHIKFLWQYS
jgi:hypothetical protein